MTLLEDVVSDLEYRNHELYVVPYVMTRDIPGLSDEALIVRFVDEDADDPRRPAKMYEWRAPAPRFKDRDECLRWVFEMILQNEVHEIREFLKYKSGGRPFCPHKDARPIVEVIW